jgi:hypothetical protein
MKIKNMLAVEKNNKVGFINLNDEELAVILNFINQKRGDLVFIELDNVYFEELKNLESEENK